MSSVYPWSYYITSGSIAPTFLCGIALIKGKCAIIVTHRLGAAKLANRIIVMDAGKIVDIGTHDELLSHSGKYSEMWSTQAKWYKM